jgi:hypothetical protein
MKNRSIIGIIILVLVLSAVPAAKADKSNAKLIQELAELDAFHPGLSNDLYKEWHYFNFIDEDLKFFVSFNVGGNLTGQTGYGRVLMAYKFGDNTDQIGASYMIFPIQDVEISDYTPDLTFNNLTYSNYVKLMPNGYKVHAEGNVSPPAPLLPYTIIFDAIYHPKADPTSIFSGDFGDTGDMNWISAAPASKVEGSFMINEVEYNLDGVRGYHDHNWGNWSWDDDIGWDWGQAIEKNIDDPDTDVGKYTLVLGRLTNRSHTSDTRKRLILWKNKRQIAVFEDIDTEFEYTMTGPYPEYINVTANSTDSNVTSVFHTSSAIPLIVDPSLTIWELTGNYTVTGKIDGKCINFITEGFAEYTNESVNII